MEYRKGADNVRADMLSRLPHAPSVATIQEALTSPTLVEQQRRAFPVEWARAETEEDEDFSLLDGELYSLRLPYQGAAPYPRLMVPPEMRPRLLSEAHTETAHRGRHAFLRRLQAFAVWPGMSQDVKSHILACAHCQGNQRRHRQTVPQITDTPQRPFEKIGLDLTGPFLPSSKGNRYLLCAVDHHTGWAEAVPIPDKRAVTVWNALMTEVFTRFAHPRTIITDNGLEWINRVFMDGCRALHIQHLRTTPVHPQSNGVVERFNRTLKDTLRKLMNNQTSRWEDHLAAALWSYRISASEARGSSPFELLYGYPPDVPDIDDPDGRFEHLARARYVAIQQQAKMKQQRHDRSRLLPLAQRHVQCHDCITIDQPEPVTLSHLRDHGYRVVSVRGKVIGYVPITASRTERPKHVHIDRVRVVPNVDWRAINPRPRRSRDGPDVRAAEPPPPPPSEPDLDSTDDPTDAAPPPASVDSDPDSDAPLSEWVHHRQTPPLTQRRRHRAARQPPWRGVKRAHQPTPSDDEDTPAPTRTRIAALAGRQRSRSASC